MHSILNSWRSTTQLEGFKENIKKDYEGISLNVDISGEATIKVLWSDTNSNKSNFVDYGDSFEVQDNDYNFTVTKKGKYFYVKVEDEANLTKLVVNSSFLKNAVKTNSSVSGVNAVICYGKTGSGNDAPLLIDGDGKLVVSGSGGGGGGDASSANQLTQITQAQLTNTKLTEANLSLDILKAEGHTQSINLEAINQQLDSIDAELVSLNSKTVKCDTDNVIIDSSNPVQVVSLAKVYNTLNNAFMTVDADQNLRVNVQNQIDTNSLALESTQQEIKGGLSSCLIELIEIKNEVLNPTAITPVAIQNPTLDVNVIDISTLATETTQEDIKTQLDKLTFNGSNELLVSSSGAGGFSDVNIKCNDVLLSQTPDGTKNCLDVQINNQISDFATQSTQNDIFLSLGEIENTTNQLNSKVFYVDTNNINGNVNLTNDISFISNSSNQNLQITEAQTTNTKLTSLDTKIIKCDTDNISGSVSVSNQLTGFSTSAKQDTQITEAQTTNTKLTSLDTKLVKCDTDNISGSVSVSNQLTGFSTSAKQDTQITEAQTTNTKLTSLDSKITKCDTDNISGSVSVSNFPAIQAISSGSPLEVRAYASSNGINWHHLSSDANGQLNVHSKTQDGNGTDITSTAVTGTTPYTALDVRVKGIETNNGLLTSTLSGTGNSVNSLDVIPRNSDATALITTSRNAFSTQLLNNSPTFNAGNTTTSVDTNGYAGFINAIVQCNTCTGAGQVTLQVSIDNTTFYSTFNSVFMSNSGSIQTNLLSVSGQVPWRYVRLIGGSGLVMSGVSILLALK